MLTLPFLVCRLNTIMTNLITIIVSEEREQDTLVLWPKTITQRCGGLVSVSEIL